MPSGIFIIDKEYTFSESARLLARAIASIADENDEVTFSLTDILCLFRSVNEYVPSEFEIQRTRSDNYKVVYKSEDEVIKSFKERWKNFIEWTTKSL